MGRARQLTVEAAEKMIREAEEADENDGKFFSVFIMVYCNCYCLLHDLLAPYTA